MTNFDRRTMTLRLEPDVWEAITATAASESVNATDIVRAALVAYLNRRGHKLSRPEPVRNRRGLGRRRETQ